MLEHAAQSFDNASQVVPAVVLGEGEERGVYGDVGLSYIGFDPRARVGVVLLANAPPGLTNFGHHLVNPSIPLEGGGVWFE